MTITETKLNGALAHRIPELSLNRTELALPERNAAEPAWLLSARKVGRARFAELGLPTLHDEDWRFTNVAPLAKMVFKPGLGPAHHGVTEKVLSQFPFTALAGGQLVFVNGQFAPELSSLAQLPAGVKVMSLADALSNVPALVEPHLCRHARTDSNAFTALNTAFFQDGAFIYVPAGQAVAEPIHLLFVSTPSGSGAREDNSGAN